MNNESQWHAPGKGWVCRGYECSYSALGSFPNALGMDKHKKIAKIPAIESTFQVNQGNKGINDVISVNKLFRILSRGVIIKI